MLNYVELSGTFEDGSGAPLSGTAVFTPNTTVYAGGIPVLTPDEPVQAQIVAGQLRSASGGTLQLLATDNSGLSFVGQTGFLCYEVTVTIAGEVLQPWSFFLPHASLGGGPVDLYSLANTPAGGGSGFANPMTALGDMIDGGAAGAAQRLAGDTSNTRKFLRTQSSGGVAQAPAWDTLQAGDIPALAYDAAGAAAAAQAAAEAASVPLSDLPLAISHGGTGQTAQQAAIDALAGSLTGGEYLRGNGTHVQMSAIQAADLPAGTGLQPWQFSADLYGAKGDGKIIGDATVAGGSLSTLTSATAAFTSGDTGKTVMLNGGQGNNAQPLITTITYVSANTVTLAHAASGAVTNASAIYGTDDTAAIQSAVTAAGAYAMAAGGPYHAQVIFGDRIYCLATPPPVTSGIAGSTTCQVRIPSPASSGATQKLILDLVGTGSGDADMYWEAAVPDIRGTALVSMCIPPFTSGTNPYPSVLGYQYAADGSLAGGFANTKAYVDGLTVVIPYLAPQGGYDFRFLGGAGGGRFSAMAFGAPVNGSYNNLDNLNNLSGQQNGSSVGLYMPLTGNNDDCTVVSFAAQGFTFGVNVTEHCSFLRLASIYNVVGVQCVGGGAHIGASVNYASVEQCFAALQYTGTSPFPVYAVLDTEQITGWHVQDTQQSLYGRIFVHTNSGAPAVLGAANCEVIWDAQSRAVEAAPSYTLGAAFQNPWWHRATILIAGGAVTGISIGPTSGSLTSLGITSGVVPLPSGWWMSIAGTVKPTTFIAAVE